MRRSILVLSTITLFFAISTGTLAATAKVAFRAESQVQPARPVAIKDMADIKASTAIAKRIGDVIVSTGPLPGSRRTIDMSFIKAKLNAEDPTDSIKLTGPEKISIVGKCVNISSQELTDNAKNFIMEQLQNDNRTYDVVVDRVPRAITAPYGEDVQIKPRLMNSSVRIGCNTVALDIVIDDKLIATTSAALQVKAVADVLIAKTIIRQGEALTAENTSWEKRDISRSADAILADQEARDLVARHSIRQGCTICEADVTQPAAVRKGDSISLIVKCGGIKLHTTAEAKQSGKVGDTIAVRSTVSNEDVRAEITEPGVAEINR